MLHSDRITLVPLTPGDLEIYADSPAKLACQYGLSDPATLDHETLEALNECLLPNIKNPTREFLFYTMWLVVDHNIKTVVASLCFHGEPEAGIVEIGYGTSEKFRNKHYITEALQLIIGWAKKRTDIRIITAETEAENLPSQKALRNNRFYIYNQNDHSIFWKIDV
ncbi:MAG: GNAT family N-acetyltransferase [Paludibacter sp.]|nr:GNAT family N-acetyltransferase [Paludibacter sp.]